MGIKYFFESIFQREVIGLLDNFILLCIISSIVVKMTVNVNNITVCKLHDASRTEGNSGNVGSRTGNINVCRNTLARCVLVVNNLIDGCIFVLK